MLRALVIIFFLSLVSGCLYRPDVQQGNEINSEMLANLSPGMSKREVIRVLGYPLINDPFNRDRWDYFYSFKEGRTKNIRRQSATLLFEGDTLKSVEANLSGQIDQG